MVNKNKTGMRWRCDCGWNVELVFYEIRPSMRYKIYHNGLVVLNDVLVRGDIPAEQFAEAILGVLDYRITKSENGMEVGVCGYADKPTVRAW